MLRTRSRPTLLIVAGLCLALASPAVAQNLASFEQKLTEHKLENGLTVLVYERHEAPVVSFFTHVDAGAAQEVPGITGLAHMFEHMAFKGTSKIGTSNFKAEKKAMAKTDEAYRALELERQKTDGGNPEKVAELEQAFKDAQEAAREFVVSNEFGEIIDREGGTGLNAFTSSDETGYFYSMPANKVELWAYLESERFLDPVFREFYKERDVVQEERRLGLESQPIGRMIEQFLTTAFTAHPYKQPVVGYMSDLQSFTREDADIFYKKYYVPSNIVVSIVGDVKASEVIPIVEKYFGRLPAGPHPKRLRTVEPKSIAEKTVVCEDPSQPFYLEAFHRPSAKHEDSAVYDAIADVLSNGRTSRLYRSLVRDKKIAAQAAAFPSFPGEKYPHLMILFGVPTPEHTNEEVQDAIRAEIKRITEEPITDEELKMVKTRAKADLIRGLDSNQGLAIQLATAKTLHGDWREVFRRVDKIEKVTKADIMRVAKSTFVSTNRVVGMIETSNAEDTE